MVVAGGSHRTRSTARRLSRLRQRRPATGPSRLRAARRGESAAPGAAQTVGAGGSRAARRGVGDGQRLPPCSTRVVATCRPGTGGGSEQSEGSEGFSANSSRKRITWRSLRKTLQTLQTIQRRWVFGRLGVAVIGDCPTRRPLLSAQMGNYRYSTAPNDPRTTHVTSRQ